ncbi:MAG: hypothetical protein H6Q65_562 [Firmicutes bacterium]|nr:hypothetical protein [Bacillota bacterium]
MIIQSTKKIWCMLLFSVIFVISGCGGGIIGLHAEQKPPLHEVKLGNFDSKIKISVPFELNTVKEPDMPESIRKYILGQEAYEGFNKIMAVQITNCCYNEKVLPREWKPSLEGAVDGAVNGMAKNSSISNFSSTRTPTVVTVISGNNKSPEFGVLTKQLYYDNKNKIPIEQQTLFVTDGLSLWMVMAKYGQNDEPARKLVDNILQTFAIIK